MYSLCCHWGGPVWLLWLQRLTLYNKLENSVNELWIKPGRMNAYVENMSVHDVILHTHTAHTFPSSVLACCKVMRTHTHLETHKNMHARTQHTCAHTHSRRAKANTLSPPTRREEWQSTTFFHQQPTDPPQVTSDLDDNKLSSPSLLLGKHRKLANTQNGVPILCVCVNVRPCLCVST